jgi:hypothetical protein
MKKILVALLIILMIILSACGSSATTTVAANPQTSSATADTVQTTATSGLTTSYTDAVSAEYQLLVGTFKLEGTNQAVTQAQAATLLPLWQLLQSVSQSQMPGQGGPGAGGPSDQAQSAATPTAQTTTVDTQSQIDTIVQKIVAAMTADQIKAITDMQITNDMAQTVMSAQGITVSTAQPGNGGQAPTNGQQPSAQGTPQAGGPQGGQQPQGTPPSGNSPAAQGTPQASGPNGQPSDNGQSGAGAPTSGAGNFIPTEYLNAIVQLLQSRSTGESNSDIATKVASVSNVSSNQQPANGGGDTSSNTTATSGTAAYSLDSGAITQDGLTYSAGNQDESAVKVTNTGNLTLTNATITSSGNTSSTDNSSFYGLNAAVLAYDGGTISLSNSSIITSGTGANGAFASGTGASVTLSNDTIKATGDGGHGVMATRGGTMSLTNTNITTSGGSSSAIATDRGGGTIAVNGGTITTSGNNSADIYSTGAITVSNATMTSSGAETAVIEGANSITLTDTSLTSSYASKWGVMIYQSMSGDAEGTEGTFTMTGGSLAYTSTDGPLFFVTNSTAKINLTNVKLTAGSGVLLKASAGSWGTNGSNGGTVIMTADGQTLDGNLVADNISSLTLTLQSGSTLKGSINADDKAKSASLTLDASSSWTLTTDSYLTVLSDASGISGSAITNITGNGHTVYYDASNSANSALGGLTYTLVNGGQLTPIK